MMTLKRLASFLVPFALAACHPTDDNKGPDDAAPFDSASKEDAGQNDAASGGGTACYVASQLRCHEYPEPTGDQAQNLAVECSSDSGDLGGSCPMAGFVGKCTLGTGAGREIRRFYTGADVAYQQDFCVNTAMGVWSTTF